MLMKSEEKQAMRSRINQEGLDYCFRHYANFEEILDKKFHKLRKDYIKASSRLLKYLDYLEY